jgi:SAM-dependent methyltransferase
MVDFDEHADSYGDEVATSIAFSGTEHEYFLRRKAELLVELTEQFVGPPASVTALDVGCGVGSVDALLVDRLGSIDGVDPSEHAIELAAARQPRVRYKAASDGRLPYEDGSFTLVFAICVLHHVDTQGRRAFMSELARVTRPGGLVAVFEHNPFNPFTRIAVGRCEFDEDAVLLSRREVATLARGAGLDVVSARYVIFTTSDRRAVQRSEARLGWLPLGAQHYVAARRPASGG